MRALAVPFRIHPPIYNRIQINGPIFYREQCLIPTDKDCLAVLRGTYIANTMFLRLAIVGLECVQQVDPVFGHFFSQVLVYLHGHLYVFMAQTILHIFGRSTFFG